MGQPCTVERFCILNFGIIFVNWVRESKSESNFRKVRLESHAVVETYFRQVNYQFKCTSGSGAKQIRFDLTMDLLMLRQVRATEDTFVRGSPAFDEVAAAMQSLGDSRFNGLTKKGVRGRTCLL